ncbi:MAG TPA: hypothetical protein VMG41_05930 [Gemmatimonadales bacterium]|nr:hypothetical protein [Gemmatimonadales bacterium]
MYRIRTAGGGEAVYNSLEEFTAAVRRGEVPPEAEIFHSRANRWLDVKSHPHYRNAANFSGPLTPGVFGPPATESPRVVASAPASPHQVAPSRMQIAELPVPAKATTQAISRPQLVAERPALEAKPQPERVKADLEFLDLGSPSQAPRQNATIIQAQKPPAVAAPPPKVPTPATDPEFLVMDTGLERPIRTSQGHRRPGDDLDLLFDTPLNQIPGPEPAPSSPAPAAPRVSRPTPVPASARELAAVKATEATRPEPAKHAEPRLRAPLDEELDIPGPPLLVSPLADLTTAMEPPHHGARGGVGLVVGSGAAAMLTAGALLVWRPWQRSPHPDALAVAEPQSVAAQTAPQATSASVSPPEPEREHALPPSPFSSPHPDPEPRPHPDSTRAPDSDQIVAAAAPSFQSDLSVPTTDLGLTPSTGSTTATAAVPPAELAKRLDAAERRARTELVAALSGFHDVLNASRLGAPGGVSQARADWNSGVTALRQYRARIARLEQTYEDSVLASQRAQSWSPDAMRPWATRQSPAEPTETSQLAELMFAQVNEGLDVLGSLQGQYEIRDGRIKFSNPTSGTRFLSIRTWVDQRMQSWAATPDGARPPTVSAILRALGEGFPSVE